MKYRIDLSEISTKKEFHEKIAEVLPCPDYYGNNLDALYDVLAEPGEEREIVFSGCGAFGKAQPGYMSALRELCGEALRERPGLRVIFEEESFLH